MADEKLLKREYKAVRELMLETAPNDLYWRGYLDALVKAYGLLFGYDSHTALKEIRKDDKRRME